MCRCGTRWRSAVRRGAYPWYIEGDSATTVYIKNITDHPQQYIAHILFSGGVYTAGVQTVEGRQTIAFNLRELRDNQVPDEEGRTIPRDVSRGQILWSLDQGAPPDAPSEWEELALIGRSEQVDISEGISSNYACQNCCINDFSGGEIEPAAPPDGDVGSVVQFTAKQCKDTCYLGELCSQASNVTWSSTNTNAVIIDSSGLAVARGGGSTTITAKWPVRTSYSVPCDPSPELSAPCSDVTSVDGGAPAPDLAGCGSCLPLNTTFIESADWTVRPEVAKIQYQSGSSFVDITGTLYVLKGTAVTFKAIPNPTNAAWPSGRPVWGGSSGATGTGPTKAVTFNTVSSSTSDYKTVTASSGNTVTVKVVVYDLTAVLTPVDNFTGRSYVRFGIEERIGLSFTASPSVTATNAGGLQWKIASGGGMLEAVMTDGTATYLAPEIPGAVALKLEVQAGPSKGNGLSKNITIVAPSGGYEAKAFGTYIRHDQNSWSVGFLGEIYLLPKDVSFLNLRFVEGDIPAVATGWLAAPFNGVSHYPDPIPRVIGSGNINTGSLVSREDGVWTGIVYPNPTYGIGDVYWDIPWKYVTSSGNRGLIGTARQHATSNQLGTATIEKAGAGPYSRVPSDPTSDWQ